MQAVRPENYRPRAIDRRIDQLLRSFGAVEIAGPKWCGKTWTSLAHAGSADLLTDPSTLLAAQSSPDLVLSGERPHLIDEWQEVPQIWDMVRSRIDSSAGERGQFILTGSSAPHDIETIRHSGAGRIARVHMRPMTTYEAGATPGGVSLRGLFDGKGITSQRCESSIESVARWCCRGGWPSILDLDDEDALETPAQYLRNLIEVNMPQLRRSPDTTRSLLRALSMNLAQAPTMSTLSKDMGSEGEEKSRHTIRAYLDDLRTMYLLEDVPGWEPTARGKKRVRIKPKRYFVDPSLPAAMLGLSPSKLLRDTQTLGGLFETLVCRDLLTFTDTLPGVGNSIAYYRDDKGLEVDFIIELADGRWGAFEVKLSSMGITDRAVERLHRFHALMTGNPMARTSEPSFLGFIVGHGEFAYQRDDGLLVLPYACIEP